MHHSSIASRCYCHRAAAPALRFARALILIGLLAACSLIVDGGGSVAHGANPPRERPGLLDHSSPFQGACLSASWPTNNVALKGLALRLTPDASMLFDTDLLRMAAGWTGGFISTHGVAFDGAHGSHPEIIGEQHFGLPQIPGWANAKGEFVDPRAEPFGPLPHDWCRWDGLYLNGPHTVLSYTVHGTKIYEQPGVRVAEPHTAFVRTFKIGSSPVDLTALICEVEGATVSRLKDGNIGLMVGTNITIVGLAGRTSARLEVRDSGVRLKVPKGDPATLFSVVLWRGPVEQAGLFAQFTNQPPEMLDFAAGGPLRWPETVVTKGVLNTSVTPDGAYATDSITAPTDNPWKRRVRFGGFDFFADGNRAAFCTHDGDIWIVSGLNDSLERLEWRRFASGLYEPLGLVVVNDVIYTSGRDQITRFRDFNRDGEADYYENFNNQVMSTEGFHEFVFDLQTDQAGNFYFAKASPVNAGGGGFGNQNASRGNGTVCSHSGALFKVSPDGKTFAIIATGFRAPTGIGVRADGQITTSDNEGTWVPTTPINWIYEPGQFCGVIHSRTPKEKYDQWVPPLCWLSKQDYDNSGGGQIWVPNDKWGPFAGSMLHESYGRSSLFLVMDQVLADGRRQGGVVRLPLKFTSSVMRARFHPKDGQLYVAGLSEWQSNAGKITGFDRVRYTGKPVYSVRGLKVVPGGVELSFTQPLEPATANDAQNFSGKRWNYERAEHYGSPEFSISDPKKRGRDVLTITATRLGADGRTVFVAIDDLKPVMQQSLKFNLKAADGTVIAQEVQHTIHDVPAR